MQVGQSRVHIQTAVYDPGAAGYHILRQVKDRHDDGKAVGEKVGRDKGLEDPFEDIEGIEVVHVVLFQYHLDQLVDQHEGQDHPRDGNDNIIGQRAYHVEHAPVPALRGLTHLRRNVRHLIVYGLKYACVLSRDRLDHALFDPVCYPVKQTAHKGLPEQVCKKRDQRGAHQRNTAAGHELCYSYFDVKLKLKYELY